MRIIHLEEIDSTNSYLERDADKYSEPVLVTARTQTSGRGQRGNKWESRPGQNLTFSALIRPKSFRAADQFAISEATALAVADFLAIHWIEAKVKWPNDVYVGDRKICGILIKHSLLGNEISYSILGAGINVNQTEFLSDAPNPISMSQATGKTYDLDSLTTEIADCIERRIQQIYGETKRLALHEEFMKNLWRGDGSLYPFADTATGEQFEACIDSIGLDGRLTLRLPDGARRNYWFKEVSFL